MDFNFHNLLTLNNLIFIVVKLRLYEIKYFVAANSK